MSVDLEEIRRCSVAVYAATEKVAADDISRILRSAADEIVHLRGRLRTTAQTLIAEIGAAGPQDADGAAVRAVEEIKRLRDQIAEMKEQRRDDALESKESKERGER